MNSTTYLSVCTVTLMSINIMFGTGLFINSIGLIQSVGSFGFLSYSSIALMIVPLILNFSQLLKRYPIHGFYAYSAHNLGSLTGFVSAWSYYVSKLASAALLIVVCSKFMASLCGSLDASNLWIIQVLCVLLLSTLNMGALKTRSTIIYLFLLCKMIPVLFVIASAIKCYGSWSIATPLPTLNALASSIPAVLYAFTGFEACCSLSGLLAYPARQASQALIMAFASVVTLTIVYQLMLSIAFTDVLMSAQPDIFSLFTTLLTYMYPGYSLLQTSIISVIYVALACACAGGAYGILMSNQWNVHTLAMHNHLLASLYLKKFNKAGSASRIIVLSGCIVMFYIILCRSDISILQSLSVFGCTVSFSLSMLSLLIISQGWRKLCAFFGLVSCVVVMALCIRNFYTINSLPLIVFGGLLFIGLINYAYMHYYKIIQPI